jgi:hypothetical protein
MSKLSSIRTLGILFALMAYLFSITTLSPAGAETGSIPVTVTASPTVGLVDGQAITVTVTAGSSPIYGVEARQCSSAAGSIDYTADFSPTVSGKCAATALGSAGADVYQSVTTVDPHSSATLTFKVGKGTSTFALQSGGNATVTCNGTNDCKLTLLLQVTGGTVFKSIPFGWTDSPPATPGQPTAVAGDGSAAVTVVAPTSGGTPTSYTVTASPGTAQCTVTGASGSCTVNGLTNGTPYTFTSTATNVAGTSSSSVASASVTPGVSGGARFNPVTPVRILDTRTTNTPSGVAGRVAEGGTLNLQITGANGIPVAATAVVMNVTAVTPTGAGFVTVWPRGVTRPLSSNLNFAPGDVVPNLVTVGIGTSGQVSLYHQGGSNDLVADVVGYYSPASGDYFTPLTPVRALDTRTTNTPSGTAARVAQGGEVSLTIANANGVPANATGVVLNVTAVGPTAAGYVTVYPNGVTRPLASNLNFVPGDIIPNSVIVGIGTAGKVNLFNANGTIDLVADIVGYYSPDNTAKQFFSITPVRALDTRNGTGGFSAAVGQGASIDLTIRGANGIPNTASAIVMNTTAVLPTGGSFLTVWPTGVTRPLASNLNFVPGDIIPNLVQVGIGSNGKVSLFNNAGAVNLVADLTGYFA